MKWLQNPATQAVLGIAALAIAIVAWRWPREPAAPRPVNVSDYVVCISEYERDCAPHNAYLYCYVDPTPTVKEACKRGFTQKGPPQSRGVAKCGATMITYICSNDVP